MILIALGANLPSHAGPPGTTIAAALDSLAQGEVEIRAVSPFYKTIAWPDPAAPAFINVAASIGTVLQPLALMTLLHQVETAFGRKRSAPNAPRTLDIDLIDYEGRIEPGPPQLPHARATTRNFVLMPIRDIAPGWRDPVSGRTVETLLAGLPEKGIIRL